MFDTAPALIVDRDIGAQDFGEFEIGELAALFQNSFGGGEKAEDFGGRRLRHIGGRKTEQRRPALGAGQRDLPGRFDSQRQMRLGQAQAAQRNLLAQEKISVERDGRARHAENAHAARIANLETVELEVEAVRRDIDAAAADVHAVARPELGFDRRGDPRRHEHRGQRRNQDESDQQPGRRRDQGRRRCRCAACGCDDRTRSRRASTVPADADGPAGERDVCARNGASPPCRA